MEIVNIAQKRALMQLDAVLEFIESCDSMPEHVLRECKMSYRNLRAKIKYHGEHPKYDSVVTEDDEFDMYVPSDTIQEFIDAYDNFIVSVAEVDDPFTYKRDNVVSLNQFTASRSNQEDNNEENDNA